jgi:epoxyqueuosine reductase QueG
MYGVENYWHMRQTCCDACIEACSRGVRMHNVEMLMAKEPVELPDTTQMSKWIHTPSQRDSPMAETFSFQFSASISSTARELNSISISG